MRIFALKVPVIGFLFFCSLTASVQVFGADACDVNLQGNLTFGQVNLVIANLQSGALPDLDSDSVGTICFAAGTVISPLAVTEAITNNSANPLGLIKIQLRGDVSLPALILDPFLSSTPGFSTSLIFTDLPNFGPQVGGLTLKNLEIVSGRSQVNGVWAANQDVTLNRVHFVLSGANATGVVVNDSGSFFFEMKECSGQFSGNSPRVLSVQGPGDFTTGGGQYLLYKNKFTLEDNLEPFSVSTRSAFFFQKITIIEVEDLEVVAPTLSIPKVLELDRVRFGDLRLVDLNTPESDLGIHLKGSFFFGKISGKRRSLVRKPILIEESSVLEISNWRSRGRFGLEFSAGNGNSLFVGILQDVQIGLTSTDQIYGIITDSAPGGIISNVSNVLIDTSYKEPPYLPIPSNPAPYCVLDSGNMIQQSQEIKCI